MPQDAAFIYPLGEKSGLGPSPIDIPPGKSPKEVLQPGRGHSPTRGHGAARPHHERAVHGLWGSWSPDKLSVVSANRSIVMDGRPVAQRILHAVREKVNSLRSTTAVVPCLATILVGNNHSATAYVRAKRKRCEEVGVRSWTIELPVGTTTESVLGRVRELAADPAVHAILVQHPVPAPIDRRAVFEAIPLAKDIDAVSSAALGRVILGMPAYAPCTPLGIMRLLRAYDIMLEGMDAVVIGRSPILGRPMASMLINAHATVTLCHSHTRDLASIVRRADLVIAAVGRPRFIQGEWIKPGAVVIDAGYNEGNVGDVDFESAAARAGWITPVPGGVGPMTIATLIDQTVDATAAQLGVQL